MGSRREGRELALQALYRLDVAGHNDNARALSVLPDNRVLLVGGGRNDATNLDGMLVMLTPEGKPDTTFGTDGRRVFDLGGPNDFFWSVSVAPDQKSIAAVGVAGAATEPGSPDDDAVILVLPL